MSNERQILGYVWGCGDSCWCTQARIQERIGGNSLQGYNTTLWEGTWFCEEPGAEEELISMQCKLRETDPELEALIEWDIED